MKTLGLKFTKQMQYQTTDREKSRTGFSQSVGVDSFTKTNNSKASNDTKNSLGFSGSAENILTRILKAAGKKAESISEGVLPKAKRVAGEVLESGLVHDRPTPRPAPLEEYLANAEAANHNHLEPESGNYKYPTKFVRPTQDELYPTKLPTGEPNLALYAFDLAPKLPNGFNAAGETVEKLNLARTDAFNANLEGLTAHGGDLRDANITGSNLKNADLRHANMDGANLTDVNLTGAKLQSAKLTGVNLTGAKLQGAKLQGADLSRTILVFSKDNKHPLSTVANGTEINSATKLPDRYYEPTSSGKLKEIKISGYNASYAPETIAKKFGMKLTH